MLIITRQELIDNDACQDALDVLDELGIKDIRIADWNKAAQGFALGSQLGRHYLMWLYQYGLIPIYSMSQADLRGANLREADLRGADLWGTDLRGANLWEADLRGANLRKANLKGANLKGTNLKGTSYNQFTKWPDGFEKETL